jgi:hypothetical protein
MGCNPGFGRQEDFPLTKAEISEQLAPAKHIRQRIFESRQSWSTALIYRRAP